MACFNICVVKDYTGQVLCSFGLPGTRFTLTSRFIEFRELPVDFQRFIPFLSGLSDEHSCWIASTPTVNNQKLTGLCPAQADEDRRGLSS